MHIKHFFMTFFNVYSNENITYTTVPKSMQTIKLLYHMESEFFIRKM